jgi:hypothetical protein
VGEGGLDRRLWDQTNSQRTKLAPVLYRECRTPHFLRNKKPFDLTTNQPEGIRQIRTWLLGLRPAPPPVIKAVQNDLEERNRNSPRA